ncbi:hypothetical protein C5C06_06060 [Rathayibacter tritici]|nr:hypothetical protein C5C06_06060 [Rathayibacter tritici]PPI50084.1 hypothetical protein C5D18_00945 [Rathayibacter tritici]
MVRTEAEQVVTVLWSAHRHAGTPARLPDVDPTPGPFEGRSRRGDARPASDRDARDDAAGRRRDRADRSRPPTVHLATGCGEGSGAARLGG